jgi:5-methyltetrahydrofolate--homocysteine methyltransferase
MRIPGAATYWARSAVRRRRRGFQISVREERRNAMSILDDLRSAVINGDRDSAKRCVEQALSHGGKPGELLNDALIPAMTEVGERFERQEFFVPEMLVAARAMKEALALLKPHLQAAKVRPVGSVLLATVRGDLHDIGKNLVGVMMEGAGFEVIDLGVDASPEKVVAAVKEHNPNLVGLSALLTTSMPMMREVIEALTRAGARQGVKVIVGGAPLTQEYATSIGADLYAPDAASAARVSVKALQK